MARPLKEGLNYFPFDVDFFNDEKIEAISGEFGIKGEIIAVKLLCAIYRQGYFILWSDMLKMKLLKSAPGITLELLDQIVNRLVRWGFFDRSLFDSVRVLTSVGIQKRYFSIAKRRNVKGQLPYLLNRENDKDAVSACNNEVSACNNPVSACNNAQSKVKESKLIDDDELSRARRQNEEFMALYFSGETDVTPLLMQLHRENPSTRTVDDFKELAGLVICEWEQNREKPATDYNSWAKRLLAQVRIKNRILKDNTNGTTDNNRRDAARQKRDESFARGMQGLLRGSKQMP